MKTDLKQALYRYDNSTTRFHEDRERITTGSEAAEVPALHVPHVGLNGSRRAHTGAGGRTRSQRPNGAVSEKTKKKVNVGTHDGCSELEVHDS